MSSAIADNTEIDRLARLFTKALFNLHSDSTASTTPARLSSIITEEPSSRSLPLALVKASLGFASAFEDLVRVLVRTLKAVLAYDRVKRLQIEDSELGVKGFVELIGNDFFTEVKGAYRTGGRSFKLREEDGTLNTLNPCLGAAFFSAVAVTQGFTSVGDYHNTVALDSLNLRVLKNEAGEEEDVDARAREANTTASLIIFAVVGPKRYAGTLAKGDLTSQQILERLRGLKESGAVLHSNVLSLLDIIVRDSESESAAGRSETEVYSILFQGSVGV